ncbi:MAG: response regulator, partial [Planctomycetota bacterium]
MTNGEIFIVDDNLNNLKLLEDILNKNNYKVRMANSGDRAIKAIQIALPNLIMLDITMPQMDGFTVCQKLKEDPKTANVPIIFISALDDVHDKIRAFQLGGIDYVTKPFQTEEVLARVENQLKISRLQQELIRSNEELAKRNQELLLSYQKLEQLYARGNQIFSAFTEILPGMILDDKYHLERIIGIGSFGTVFQAVNIEIQKPVALKILKPSSKKIDEDIERFRTEGNLICRLTHPSAVSVFDLVCSSSGIIYLVMELLNGTTLENELQEKKTLPLNRCFTFIAPICGVLSEAHSLGIVHCDIKPENIFLHQSKTGEIIKILDFGISKLAREEEDFDLRKLTLSEDLYGTPTYMAPERIQNLPYDGRADVYSLG